MDFWITKLLHILLIFVSVYSQEIFNTMPPPVNTNFTCRGRDIGFYADVETNCRVYHTCDDHGNKFTYYCPEETAFRQEALVCDHAHLVDCKKGQTLERVSTFTGNNGKNKENNKPRSSHAESSLNEARSASGRSIDVFQSGNSNPAYTRSFRITAEPPGQFPTPKSLNRKQPTFVLNSSVYLRDRVNYQKALPASQNNRVATESSKNFDQVDGNEQEENTDGFSRDFPSAPFTTTFKPIRAENDKPMNFNNRYFNKNEENDEFAMRFSPSTSATTFRPFVTDFKVNHGIVMDSQFSSFPRKDEKLGPFGRASTIFTTTLKPFTTDFKVNHGNVMDSQLSSFHKKEDTLTPFGRASTISTTTFKPFITDFKVNRGSAMDSQFSRFHKKDEKIGPFGRVSTISTTTFKPFTTDFKVNRNRQTFSDTSFRKVNKNNENLDRFSSASSTTTLRPFVDDFKVEESSDDLPGFEKVKFATGDRNSESRMLSDIFNHDEINPRKAFQIDDKIRSGQKHEFGSNLGTEGKNSQSSIDNSQKNSDSRNLQGFAKNNNKRPAFAFDNSNFPYFETLRSMQAQSNKSLQPKSSTSRPFVSRTTFSPRTTAGTEFPVHRFTGSLSPLVPNELEDDPYYPKRSTTTEAYYKLNDRDKSGKRIFRIPTRRPWPGSLDFEIPEVLPDFNTLDDLVDRRKLFFIPRVKAN